MNGRDMQEYEEQLEAYALGALDGHEVASVEEYLRSHPQARPELDALRDVVALLPYAADDAVPPPHVKQRLMNRITADLSPDADTLPRSAPLRRNTGRIWAPMAALAAMFLLALSLGMGSMVWSLQNTVTELSRSNAALVAEIADVQAEVQALEQTQDQMTNQLAASREQVNQLTATITTNQNSIAMLTAQLTNDQHLVTFISAPGVATRQLVAVNENSDASGEMYMYPGDNEAVVLFRGLPELSPGLVYQFWLANDGNQVAAGTLHADADGLARLQVTAPREVNAFNQVMLTIEPEGGSTTPSEEVVLEGFL